MTEVDEFVLFHWFHGYTNWRLAAHRAGYIPKRKE